MNGVEADDRWDPETQGPAPDWMPKPPPVNSHTRRDGVYTRGAAACRAILREHGAPEHGPHWVPKKEDA